MSCGRRWPRSRPRRSWRFGASAASGEYREAIERISTRARELAGIVETLLSVARTEGSVGVGETSELRRTVADAVASAQDRADSYGVSIEIASGPAIRVLGEADTVRRIISPVLENACVFAGTRVWVEIGGGESPRVTIIDDGPGFDPGEIEEVLEPGRRGSAERNARAPKGSGLGLALARRLALALGGELQIETPASGGGRVSIHLPAARAEG